MCLWRSFLLGTQQLLRERLRASPARRALSPPSQEEAEVLRDWVTQRTQAVWLRGLFRNHRAGVLRDHIPGGPEGCGGAGRVPSGLCKGPGAGRAWEAQGAERGRESPEEQLAVPAPCPNQPGPRAGEQPGGCQLTCDRHTALRRRVSLEAQVAVNRDKNPTLKPPWQSPRTALRQRAPRNPNPLSTPLCLPRHHAPPDQTLP